MDDKGRQGKTRQGREAMQASKMASKQARQASTQDISKG
jgi:hypothetical protein